MFSRLEDGAWLNDQDFLSLASSNAFNIPFVLFITIEFHLTLINQLSTERFHTQKRYLSCGNFAQIELCISDFGWIGRLGRLKV